MLKKVTISRYINQEKARNKAIVISGLKKKKRKVWHLRLNDIVGVILDTVTHESIQSENLRKVFKCTFKKTFS